ncbi:PCMD domain-containing protein [Flammeovirga agarivorans]|uniref:Putative carbohydrate metabolism domain-containing protein n=1 Tax=Flammeovirga agarivorans TaxID=2726742 RepID=A0A7X8SPV7_9BACT|nr:PCMD domain-containing protein [Flammeovirga agarivorans]NLR94199.1 hypothetical protein [Flammeovirga agarivorans]
MKLTFKLLSLGLSSLLLFSCDSDSDDTPQAEPYFEDNLSLDTWEVTEFGADKTYETPIGWETSNPGTSFLSFVNTTQETSDVVSGSSARMETIAIPLTGIAAATVYTGKFQLNTSDPAQSAILGVEYTKRPKSMSFNYKYTPGDEYLQFDGAVSSPVEGAVDSCLVYMYLQKREGESIQRIGTAAMQHSDTVTEWTKEKLEVIYGEIENPVPGFRLRPEETGWADADATPTHVIITFTSTSAGDYFRGAIGSVLMVDDISIEY